MRREFCAESVEKGVPIAHTFFSKDWDSAERFALSMGWHFVGELVESVEAEDDLVAMLEKTVTNASVH